VKYRHALPEDCADREGSFDVVMSLEVVEHVADLPMFLESLTRLVAPRGWGIAFNPLTMRWGVSRDLSTNYLQFHRKN
jgi:cyclopropane fatty-acyl-phospholipid synthase-like methyltransferase